MRTSVPRFVEAKAETCLNEGDDLHLHCQILFSKNEPNYSRIMRVALENGTLVNDLDKSTWDITLNYTFTQ